MSETKSLVSYNSDDLTKVLDQIEALNNDMKLCLDMTINREHVIDHKGARQEVKIIFKGTLDPSKEADLNKFQQKVQTLVGDSEKSVYYEVDFREKPKVMSLREEEEANKKLAQSHEQHKSVLQGIDNPIIKMTSKRTYSSRDGEKFSGNLHIGGNCPADLKENFIKYYNEVAKPMPKEYAIENQARLVNEPKRPVLSCGICKNSLDESESFFSCLTCSNNRSETNLCDTCVNKANELANFTHPHPMVLVPKKNEIRSQVSKKWVPSSIDLWKNDPIFKSLEKDFGALNKQLLPEIDTFNRGWVSAIEPLNQRFREFERIADRIERNLRPSFISPIDELLFPFEPRPLTDIL
jgi:hypothetical protein